MNMNSFNIWSDIAILGVVLHILDRYSFHRSVRIIHFTAAQWQTKPDQISFQLFNLIYGSVSTAKYDNMASNQLYADKTPYLSIKTARWSLYFVNFYFL